MMPKSCAWLSINATLSQCYWDILQTKLLRTWIMNFYVEQKKHSTGCSHKDSNPCIFQLLQLILIDKIDMLQCLVVRAIWKKEEEKHNIYSNEKKMDEAIILW